MSRGLGRIERALLAEVTPRWGMVVLIGERLYGENPTDVQLVGLRRAARSLAAKGLVELKYGGVEVGTSRWTGLSVHRVRQRRSASRR